MFYLMVQFEQCDQMAKLLLQYVAIYSNKNWHNSLKNYQSRFKIMPNTKLTPKIPFNACL